MPIDELIKELKKRCSEAENSIDYRSGLKVGKTMAGLSCWQIRDIIRKYEKAQK